MLGNLGLANALLVAGADPNAVASDGMTAASLASDLGHETMRALITSATGMGVGGVPSAWQRDQCCLHSC